MHATIRAAVGIVLVAAFTSFAPAAADLGPSKPVVVTSAGASGSGRIEDGRTCADGGDGRYWHYEYAGPVEPGEYSARPAELRLHLDLHHDAGAALAFLLGQGSHASLLDDRGTIRVRLESGTCTVPTLAFDGSTASGGGIWAVDDGAGGYEGVTGSGTFQLAAAVDPGADNPWELALEGDLAVPMPELEAEVVDAYWGGLGTDYLTRRVTVVYRITNVGEGHAYGAQLASATSPTPGVTPMGPAPQPLGDLLPGEETTVAVRYQLGLLQPCQLVILGCDFQSRIQVNWVDALDQPFSPIVTGLAVSAPDLPPPL